ncbi:MAG: 16S rRNA (cytidine(1402)-2'-O)-methyltransferase [Candidatus Omnitrophica bacterium]|nr:16S rRNA (cytidine(1402)-2'-O)-methyltransferase [Candidatus Omnitrophota bacterium]
MLYIVATPIGNLKDITLRALEVLRSVDLIACEDTRHTRILLNAYDISTPTTSYFQHNKITKARMLMDMLRDGKSVALVSDAGTPGILDPGYHLIQQALKQDLPVTCIPGPCALIPALVLSGKPAHSFSFAGFLPPRSGARQNRLKELLWRKETVVCYESCHRLLKTLADIESVTGEKEVVVCRELTKKFEEVRRGRPAELITYFSAKKIRGEFVIVV